VFRFIIYLYKLRQIIRYYKLYIEYLNAPKYEFSQHKPQIIDLFKEADLEDFPIQRLEPAGYGQLKAFEGSGFANITSTDGEVVTNIKRRFNEAAGVFRHRMIQSVNPLFWIEFTFKLPQYLFQYLGVLPDKLIVKIALLIYWVVALILGLKRTDLFSEIFK
jgi:hypothetical protein